MKSKEEGSPEEEASETPKEESKEGIVIPEEFQQDTHSLLQKATSKHHLSHIRDRVYAKEDEMRKEESKKKGKSSKEDSTMSVDPSME